MPTAQSLINIAAGQIGVTVPNTALGSDESADALVKLNSMLDSWRMDRLMVYQIVQVSGTWPAATASRAVGPGSTFIGFRPDKIESAFFTDSDGNDFELRILLRQEYDRIQDKTLSGTYPTSLYYDNSYLTGMLYLYLVPDTAITVKLNMWQPLQQFASLTVQLMLPPGYQLAIESNLSLMIAPFYGKSVSQELALQAKESKALLKRVNSPLAGVLQMPAGVVPRANILTGQ